MPGNNVRQDRATKMGFPSIELDHTTAARMRPLVGLQVWLYAAARDSAWAQAMAPRVVEVNPEGLYLHWAGMKHGEDGSFIIKNPVFGKWPFGLDPYDLVRLDPPTDPLRQFDYLDKLAEMTAPVKQAPPPAAKPWWED